MKAPETVSIRELENGVVEYNFGTAIVRIHPGKLTEEERKKVLTDAAKRFYKAAIQQETLQKKNTDNAGRGCVGACIG